VDPQLQWLIYLPTARCFVTGDDRRAYTIGVDQPQTMSTLPGVIPPGRDASINLPIANQMYDDFASRPWHGFGLLLSATTGKLDGDLLRMLVFGPDYGHCVLHPASGLVLSLRGGSIRLLSPAAFDEIDKTKTRGKAALAFAAHHTEPLVVYGDNFGTFHAHRFSAEGFGKATKIATRERKASRIEFLHGGATLLIGGMGFLETYRYENGKFTLLHSLPIAVRDFACDADGKLILVNQGMHGMAAYAYDAASGFKNVATLSASIRSVEISACGKFCATVQEGGSVSLHALEV
jgi:hypothetical protein